MQHDRSLHVDGDYYLFIYCIYYIVSYVHMEGMNWLVVCTKYLIIYFIFFAYVFC